MSGTVRAYVRNIFPRSLAAFADWLLTVLWIILWKSNSFQKQSHDMCLSQTMVLAKLYVPTYWTSTLHQPLRHLRAFVAFHLDRGMDSLQLCLWEMKIFIGEGRKPSCQHPAWWVTGFLTWPKSLWLHITLYTKPIEHLEDHVSPWSSDLCTLRLERQGGIVEAKKCALTMLCLAQAHITWLFLKTFRFSQNYAKDCSVVIVHDNVCYFLIQPFPN